MFATTLVIATRSRTGEFTLDGRRFLLRRVYFPKHPSPEWFVVDLLRHHEMAARRSSEPAREARHHAPASVGGRRQAPRNGPDLRDERPRSPSSHTCIAEAGAL